MAELHITLSDGRKLQRELQGIPETIGRDASCEIAIDDVSTSRKHARFIPMGDGYVVEDLGSKNGTLVNDAQCTRHVLKHGDQILLGSALVLYRDPKNKLPGEPSTAGSVVISDDPADRSHATRYAGPQQRLMLSLARVNVTGLERYELFPFLQHGLWLARVKQFQALGLYIG